MTDWYLGTMGFAYEQWRNGVFYPAGMQPRQYLGYYAERFNAVEMDSTFYATPTEKTVQRWMQVTPPEFKISPKVPRRITHELRLHDAQGSFVTFLETMRLLGSNLGPIVLQFPPDFAFDSVGALIEFLPLLPKDLRFAIEFRHPSWHRPETAVLLSQHHLCWVAADYIHLPKKLHRTTDFIYLRFIGPHGQYATKDREMVDKTADLQAWYTQIQPHLEEVTAVYAFFNNDYAGFSPATCNKFKRVVGMEPGEIRPLQQGRLF
ncbi:MAG: DUF72 domain-containing protein [Ardenticatenaceae bacterium]|nr:DUF72 domain-containing protein [Anaerolineales bacterium]MCB8920794.1 DUF72 domain-containing protein [Ardenticatenaceae bacterium]MCB8989753.1 DUF72 domain-containing protein [Ardenticatenaceae bacterium]MCB9002788.1 DUF72 domain-containing protein [Ardenticatenaceae bacterium]